MRISIGRVILICVMLAGGAYGITILRGYHPSSSDKRRMIEQLEKENEALHHEIVSKQNYLERLKQNPDELSLEIKRRLGLVEPGTKNFLLQDGVKRDVAPPAGNGTVH